MSITNVKKEAGILEHIPFTQDYGKRELSEGSPSYKTALSLLNNLHRSMGQCISIQKEHLKLVIKAGKAMRLQDFAKHVDGFLKEQSKITYIVTDSKLRASFDELLGSIEGELYGKHVPFPAENIVSEITSTTSIPSSLTNPPNFDWVSVGKAYIAARQKAKDTKKTKKTKQVPAKAANTNKLIESYLTKEAFFGNWYKNNYYGNLQRGQSLKGGIEQITSVLTNLYTSNKDQYKALKNSIAKGDPDEYYDNLKQLASATNIAVSQIIKPWETHFAKYTVEQEEESLEQPTLTVEEEFNKNFRILNACYIYYTELEEACIFAIKKVKEKIQDATKQSKMIDELNNYLEIIKNTKTIIQKCKDDIKNKETKKQLDLITKCFEEFPDAIEDIIRWLDEDKDKDKETLIQEKAQNVFNSVEIEIQNTNSETNSNSNDQNTVDHNDKATAPTEPAEPAEPAAQLGAQLTAIESTKPEPTENLNAQEEPETPKEKTDKPLRTMLPTAKRITKTRAEAAKPKAKPEEAEAEAEAEAKPRKQQLKKNESLSTLENIYKAASTGDQYLVAHYIIQLAEEIDKDGDEELANDLTNIAKEAFDNG